MKVAAPILALILVGLNAYVVQAPSLGLIALVLFLLALGWSFGPRLVPNVPLAWQISLGAMFSLTLISLLGSLVYYSLNVTTTSLMAVTSILAVGASLVSLRSDESTPTPTNLTSLGGLVPWQRAAITERFTFVLGLLALMGWWVAITQTEILEPTRSLWLELSPISLVALLVAGLCSFSLLYLNRSQELGGLLLMGCIFSGLSATAMAYPLGYGFDPFLHRATVEHIVEFGTITPKPLYYIGLYALELTGVKIFSLPGFWVDVLLVPILAAWGSITALSLRARQIDFPFFGLACLVFVPLAAFVQTTPQALAFTFTLWAILCPTRPLITPLLFALAAIFTHPLAGLGALAYAVLLIIDRRVIPGPARQFSLGLITVLAAISVPVAFAVQAKLAGLGLNFSLTEIFDLSRLPLTSFLTTGFNAWGDTAYILIGNAFTLVVSLAVAGIIITPKAERGWYLPLLIALAVFINFVIVSLGFDFAYLITYERADFALRLLTLTTIFLLPYVAVFLLWLHSRLTSSPLGLRLGCVVLLAVLLVTNVYAAYPRHDNYARSAGFNLGPSDFEAVTFIDQLADGQEYIVLSDQALAAAAVDTLGFKKYYPGEIFFYPIPTGGPLYQKYLSLVENRPERARVEEAMDLAGVDLAFFAVHDYWWQAPEIIENSKALADDWWAIGQGDVTVFMFTRPE